MKKGRKKKVNISLSTRVLYTFLIIGVLALLGIGIYAAVNKLYPWHSADNYILRVDGTNRALTYAISNNLLKGLNTYSSASSVPAGSHDASSLWVSTNSGEKTLLQALGTAYGLCKTSATTSYLSAPASSTAYHFANQIEVSSSPSTSFQDVIDSGAFCCVPNCVGKTCGNNGCGGSCGTCSSGYTCSPSGTCCVSNMGSSCPSLSGGRSTACTNLGTVQCSGSCTGSYKPSGTSCGTNLVCDGNGYCISSCVSNVGASCTPTGLDSSCVTGYTIQCNGACGGGTYKSKGADCIVGNGSACDGAGKCLGWTGTNCTACPFGITTMSNYHYCTGIDTNGVIYQGVSTQYPWAWNNQVYEYYIPIASPGTVCNSKQGTCCWWQAICIVPRCPREETWKLKP